MNFTAAVLGTAFAALMLTAKLQAAPEVGSELPVTTLPAEAKAVAPASASTPAAMRLIDLRSGASCKIASAEPTKGALAPVPTSPECAQSAELRRISQWRSTQDGMLVMADDTGRTVLRFIPGDGVLFESVYPTNSVVTIVPARG